MTLPWPSRVLRKASCDRVWGTPCRDRPAWWLTRTLPQLCPYYVDLQVEGPRLQAIVNKMKSISSTLTLVTTKHGHLHLQVAAEQVRELLHS